MGLMEDSRQVLVYVLGDIEAFEEAGDVLV